MKPNVSISGPAVGEAEDGAKERILSAAEALYIERGFDGVSIADIAAKAGTAKALVFYYFNTKNELFDLVLDRYYQAQAKALLGALSAAGEERERIHSVVDAYIGFIESNPGFPRLIQREICSSARSAEKIRQYMAPLFSVGEKALGGVLPEGGPLSAGQLFISVFGMIVNYYTYAPVIGKLLGGNPTSGPALAERRTHIHATLDALLAGAGKVAPARKSKPRARRKG